MLWNSTQDCTGGARYGNITAPSSFVEQVGSKIQRAATSSKTKLAPFSGLRFEFNQHTQLRLRYPEKGNQSCEYCIPGTVRFVTFQTDFFVQSISRFLFTRSGLGKVAGIHAVWGPRRVESCNGPAPSTRSRDACDRTHTQRLPSSQDNEGAVPQLLQELGKS